MRVFLPLFILFGCSGGALAQPAAESARVDVLARAVERGDRLAEADFIQTEVPASRARGALSAAAASGLEAKRRMAAGEPVRSYDLGTPQLVRKGQTVVVAFEKPGLLIEGRGRAAESGGAGDSVRAQIAGGTSLVEGTVVGPGRVAVMPLP